MGKDQDLLDAARNGNIQIVDKILQRAKRSGPLASLRRGPGANVKDSSGYSALHHAALNGHLEIVELLLSHEASTNIVDNKGSSPLHLAAWTGNIDIVRALLCKGLCIPNVNLVTKTNETPLHSAAQYGHTPVVSLLLQHKCDPKIRNNKEETALDLAAQYGRLETVELLIREYPSLIHDYNSRAFTTIFHNTPLHLASRNGHSSVVERLLKSDLNINLRTDSGSALHEAALYGKIEVVKILLENGVDLKIFDSNNNTVIDLLKQYPTPPEIASIIHHYWAISVSGIDYCPPIPVPSLGSPYENVKLQRFSSPSGGSKYQWDNIRDRRISGASAVSITSINAYQRDVNTSTFGLGKSYKDINSFSDELSSFYQNQPSKDTDSISWCSTASSSGGGYAFSSSSHLPSPSNNKISSNPPKKPPRRHLSVSPSHYTADFSPSTMSYEYLMTGSNSARSASDTDDMQVMSTGKYALRRGKSADHCIDLKLKYSSTIDIDDPPGPIETSQLTRGQSEDLIDSKYQPIAITSVCENVPFRTTNPKRKLRRLSDYAQENNDPSKSLSNLLQKGDLQFKKVDPKEYTIQPITVERILIPTSDRDNESNINNNAAFSAVINHRIKVLSHGDIYKINNWPLSPTHYQQPPTPDHPPPSAKQAQQIIQDKIRPLSQEYNNLKRKSRDMETETEDELLMLVFNDNSSSSLSSSVVSMNEKSSSICTTDNNVEEFVCDTPFGGLLKGSLVNIKINQHNSKAERPKSLNQLKTVYDKTPNNNNTNNDSNNNNEDKLPTTVLSPFDENEEWARIADIMKSFGTGLVRDSGFVTELEKEFQTRLGLSRSGSLSESIELNNDEIIPEIVPDVIQFNSIEEWLNSLDMKEYLHPFVNYGYDHIDFLNGVLTITDLEDIGINDKLKNEKILNSIEKLPNKIKEIQQIINKNINNKNEIKENINEQVIDDDETKIKNWLNLIKLDIYYETFKKHLYTDMEKIKKIWEVELTAVLEINKTAHRKRILISLNKHTSSGPNLEQINKLKTSSNKLKDETKPITSNRTPATSSDQSNGSATTTTKKTATIVTSGTETLRRNHKKSRPAPLPPPLQKELEELKKKIELEKDINIAELKDPNELLNDIPESISSQWKHKPISLVNGFVTYLATYLGSTVVKELKGMESSKKSIQKLKKIAKNNEQKSNSEILFAISYQGVKFVNPLDKNLVCEHEIRNISCACQDPDDLSHFAYITKNNETGSHYCHVFSVKNVAQATEIILTLGQAFEIAYQLALKKHQQQKTNTTTPSKTTPSLNGHSRSRSVNPPTPGTPPSVQHSRSLSVHESSYLNGSIDELDDSNSSSNGVIGKAPIACTDDL